MSAGWARQGGLEHAAVFHRGADDLASRTSDLLRAAVDAGDAVLVSLGPDERLPLEDRLGGVAAEVTWLHADDRYRTPAGAMLALHRFADDAIRTGAPAVWSLGALRFDGSEDDDRWVRYEHAVNEVLRDLPVHALCAYDLDRTSPAVAAHAAAAHPTRLGPAPAPQPAAVAAPANPALPVPGAEPLVDHEVGTPSGARATIVAAVGADLPAGALDDLLLITSELTTNAIEHGSPPARLRLWRSDDHLVLQVRDAGPGITDPYAELRPPSATGGRGLNIVAQLADLHFGRDGDEAVSTARIPIPPTSR